MLPGHHFIDPVSGAACELVIPADGSGALYPSADGAGKIGVRHPGCQVLADIAVELDAFYCPPPGCGYSGRISGVQVLDMMRETRIAIRVTIPPRAGQAGPA